MERFSDFYSRKEGSRYDSYLSRVDWGQKVISEGKSQNGEKWLLNDVASFLHGEYDIPLQPNNLAILKALELMKGERPENSDLREHPPVVDDKRDSKRKLIFKKAVKEAYEKGYMENFRLAEPWHPETFFDREFVSYPHQHNSVIAYRAMSREAFYKQCEKFRPGETRHPESILKTQVINPGNGRGGTYDNAVWTSMIFDEGYARDIGGMPGIILELQVPSNFVSYIGEGKIGSLEGWRQNFDSARDFRSYLDSVGSDIRNYTFLVHEGNPQGLALEYVVGIWDLALDEESQFRKFDEEYLQKIYNLEPRKIPKSSGRHNSSEPEELSRELENLYERQQKEFEKIEELPKLIEGLNNLVGSKDSFLRKFAIMYPEVYGRARSPDERLHFVENRIKKEKRNIGGYNERLERCFEILDLDNSDKKTAKNSTNLMALLNQVEDSLPDKEEAQRIKEDHENYVRNILKLRRALAKDMLFPREIKQKIENSNKPDLDSLKRDFKQIPFLGLDEKKFLAEAEKHLEKA